MVNIDKSGANTAGIKAMAMLAKNQSDIMPLFVRNRLDAFRYIVQ
jgi:hypothetical protein